MSCNKCTALEAASNLNLPHVVRVCDQCGDEFRVREPGKHGLGFEIRTGDRPVIPAGFIKLAANPLKASGHLTAAGIDWFAKLVFGIEIAKPDARNDFLNAISQIQESSEGWFRNSDTLKGLDLDDPANGDEVFERLSYA